MQKMIAPVLQNLIKYILLWSIILPKNVVVNADALHLAFLSAR